MNQTFSRTTDPLPRCAFDVLVLTLGLLCLGVVCTDLYLDTLEGGDPWKQADWLVNNLQQPIRRGLFGSVMIWLADVFGISPLVPVFVLQATALLGLFAVLMLVFSQSGNKAALALLAFSPAFVFVFWAADPAGSLRKELLGYLAISLLLLAAQFPARMVLIASLSVLLFALACIGHEINILLAPVFAMVFSLCLRPSRAVGVAGLALLALVCGGSLAYALSNSAAADHATICAPLTERSVGAEFCIGAILWMERSAAYGAEQVSIMFLSKRNLGLYFISYGVIAAPLLYLISRVDRPYLVFAVAMLLFLPVLPLYPVAVDWGRWMNLHVMSFSFVFVAALMTRQIKIIRPVNKIVLGLTIALGLFWEQSHAGGPRLGGLVDQVVQTIATF